MYELRADMVGSVYSILYREGEEVKIDDELIILEAMKMLQTLHSPVDGIVVAICVLEGDVIDEGTILMRIKTE
jgi:biotin carboxyl carrier protein